MSANQKAELKAASSNGSEMFVTSWQRHWECHIFKVGSLAREDKEEIVNICPVGKLEHISNHDERKDRAIYVGGIRNYHFTDE